jgi:hypothetical protein
MAMVMEHEPSNGGGSGYSSIRCQYQDARIASVEATSKALLERIHRLEVRLAVIGVGVIAASGAASWLGTLAKQVAP